MKTVRKGVFETNSSSCHCVTVLSKDELQKFAKNRWHDCIYLPDTGDYCTEVSIRLCQWKMLACNIITTMFQ